MKKPYIYEDELYIFDLLLIANIKFVNNGNDSYFNLYCYTPKYNKIFNSAFFNLKSDTFFALIETIEHANDKEFKEKLKTLLNQKMALSKTETFEIDIIELKNKLDNLPVIFKCGVLAEVKDYEIENGKISWIEFEIGISKRNIILHDGKVNNNYERKIIDIAADIKTLAMQEGYDLSPGWGYLDAMFELETIYDFYWADRGSYIIKVFLGYLKNWHSERIRPLREELKKLVN